jgi:hypothetical protein
MLKSGKDGGFARSGPWTLFSMKLKTKYDVTPT